MEETGQTVVQEEIDPLDPWKTAASLLICFLITVYFCRGAEKWFYGIFLFFPFKQIMDGILDNKPRKIASGIVMLLIYPVLTGSIPLLTRHAVSILRLKPPEGTGADVFSGVCLAAVFLPASLIVSLVSKSIPEFEFPKKIHNAAMILLFSAALILALAGFYAGADYCRGKFLNIPENVMSYLPWILVVVGIAAECRMIFFVLHPGKDRKEEDPGKEKQLGYRPDTRLDDVAGMESVKEQIRLRLIEPIRNPKKAEKYGLKAGGGVLLYGPPGTGKTFLARAIAGELDLPFYMITSADVFGKYVGESEKNILELFRSARKNPLSVVFVDEMETIFSKRTDQIHESTQKVISIILQELDGVDQTKNPILLLGATNTPWRIDEAFLRPGRFDILAFVDLPDLPARKHILQSAFRKSSLKQEAGLIDYIAENTQDHSGADLNGIVTRMQQEAFRSGAKCFSKRMAYEILQKTVPASNGELLRKIRQWEAERGQF